MTSRPPRLWADWTTAEIAACDAGRLIALMPVAAIEQHGPHLPLGVDAIVAAGIVDRALQQAPPDLPVVVLPITPIGYSSEHGDFPGTLSAGAGTLSRLWIEVGTSVARAGVRKLVLFNGHGGNPAVMDIVARELRTRRNMLVVSLSWYDLGLPDDLFPADEIRHGIHGGAVETAMMMHLRPELVRKDEIQDFPALGAQLAGSYRHLGPSGNARLAWQAQDLNASGACGNATLARPEAGRRLVEHAAASLLEALAEVDRYALDDLQPPPPGA